jgi:hypothetical protein
MQSSRIYSRICCIEPIQIALKMGKTRSGWECTTSTGMQLHIHWILHGGGPTLVCWTTRKMKLEGGGHVMIVIYHCFMRQNVHLML